MSKLPNVVAVIVTYNSAKTVGLLIENLLSQTVTLKAIIVVDNASKDETVEIVGKFQDIHLLQLAENKGGAGGFRSGLQHALKLDPSFIVTMDDDAIPSSNNFIENMLSFIYEHNLDVTSPIVLDALNPKFTAYQYKVGNNRTSVTQDISDANEKICDIKLFNGAFFSNRVISEQKGPETKFFIRGDEEEFKQRILAAEYKVAVCKNAFISHPSSVGEYYVYKKKRYHHCNEGFKLYYSTRNRVHMILFHQNVSRVKKAKRLLNEFYNYSVFYLWYRNFDFSSYITWCKAFIAGFKHPNKLIADKY